MCELCSHWDTRTPPLEGGGRGRLYQSSLLELLPSSANASRSALDMIRARSAAIGTQERLLAARCRSSGSRASLSSAIFRLRRNNWIKFLSRMWRSGSQP